MKFKTVKLFLILLVFTLWGISCNSTSTSPEPQQQSLKIGVLLPLTGPSANTGIGMQQAVMMAFEEIDYTLAEYRLELVWIDSESNPEIATTAYRNAIEEQGVQVGILNWHSSVSVAVMDVAADYEIPHIFAFGATNVINKKVEVNPTRYSYWSFKGWPTPEKLHLAIIPYLEENIEQGVWQPEKKRAAILAEDTDWGRSFGRAMKDALNEYEWELVADQYAAIDETDFTESLHQFKDEEVTLFITTFPGVESFDVLLDQVDEIGLNAVVITDGLSWVDGWYEVVGEASDYTLTHSSVWDEDRSEAFIKAYETQWGGMPSISSGLSYDYSKFFIKILQETDKTHGELNSQTIHQFSQEKLRTGQISYTDGVVMAEYKYTPETIPDLVIGKDYFVFSIIQHINGEQKVIWPESRKNAEFQLKPQ